MDAEARMSVEELAAEFDREVLRDKRVGAEIAYALAFRYRNEDIGGSRHFDLSKVWAARAIELLEELPSDRLDQVASTRSSVGGVMLPEYLHADVVRERLADVLCL